MKRKYEKISPSEYAKLVGVAPSRITQLKKQLKTKTIGKHWFVLDCAENLKLFKNPSHNSNRKTK